MSVTRKDDSPADRRQTIIAAIEAAKAQIEKEIKAHDGIYPHNDGVLNQAELCRRAGINNAVLGGRAHKETTRPELNQWLDDINGKFKTKKDVRKEVTERADTWKELYEDVLWQYGIDRLDLITARAELAEKDKRIAELEDKLALLHEQLSEGKIVPIRKPGNGKDSPWQDRP